MSTAIRDKIIGYLAKDIQQSVVASSCGVTPAYVSQLLEIQEVRDEIALLKSERLEQAITADTTIERIEASALRMVEQKLPFVRSAMEAAKVFATLNAAKRKSTPNTDSDVLAAQQVVVTIPRGAALHFKLNDSNQVIEVEGRAMAPLPSKALPGLQRQLSATPDVTDIEVTSPVPLPKNNLNRKSEVQERMERNDADRAHNVLRDLTMHMDGVTVVL